MAGEIVFEPQVLPVHAQLGLVRVVGLPARVQISRETVPVSGHVRTASLELECGQFRSTRKRNGMTCRIGVVLEKIRKA